MSPPLLCSWVTPWWQNTLIPRMQRPPNPPGQHGALHNKLCSPLSYVEFRCCLICSFLNLCFCFVCTFVVFLPVTLCIATVTSAQPGPPPVTGWVALRVLIPRVQSCSHSSMCQRGLLACTQLNPAGHRVIVTFLFLESGGGFRGLLTSKKSRVSFLSLPGCRCCRPTARSRHPLCRRLSLQLP